MIDRSSIRPGQLWRYQETTGMHRCLVLIVSERARILPHDVAEFDCVVVDSKNELHYWRFSQHWDPAGYGMFELVTDA